jgi:hypothetical protein
MTAPNQRYALVVLPVLPVPNAPTAGEDDVAEVPLGPGK